MHHGGVQGRVGILEVHARDKELDEGIDFHKVARATAGSTGAELMNLMNQSAIVTVRQGRQKITQADIFEVCCLLATACPALPCPALPCPASVLPKAVQSLKAVIPVQACVARDLWFTVLT